MGVQRLVLVTPVEKVSDELVANSIVEEERVEDSDDRNQSKEVENLQVPEWMKPKSSRRCKVNTVVSYAAVHGLNLGL